VGFVEKKIWPGKPDFWSLGAASTVVVRPRLTDKRSIFLTKQTQWGVEKKILKIFAETTKILVT
jgi:hypothetical protein